MSNRTNQSNNKSRLEEQYVSNIRPQLQKSLGLTNVMQTPKVVKVVLNVGVKEAVADSKALNVVMQTLSKIAGQAPVKKAARNSIANFKIREGMHIGASVTLRGKRMYYFLDKLINLALPRVRDFQGVSPKFDGQGNYNLGIKEWIIFPEAETTGVEKVYGMNITIHTTAKTDEHGFELLKNFGMPFRKK